MLRYYLKRIGNNQTIPINQRTWSILGLDSTIIIVDETTPPDIENYFQTVKYEQIAGGFSNCRFIKLPDNSELVATFPYGTIHSIQAPTKLLRDEFDRKPLFEKIKLLSAPKYTYLYYYLSKSDLISILGHFNKDDPINSKIAELINELKSILNKNQLKEDNDSDSDFILNSNNSETTR